MKQFLILAIFLVLISGNQNHLFAQSEKSSTKTAKAPVLVELFTSEGCPTCPPADRLLTKLENEQLYANAEVITLALHVDYWNRNDWKDEYSSAIFSRRQDIYAQAFRTGKVFTPQMIIDGRSNFIGSDAAEATKAIVANARNEKANVELSIESGKLKVKISQTPQHENASVFLAIVEDDLKAGKMRGADYKHNSVVRELKSLGMLTAENNEFSVEQPIQINKDWKKENVKFVVFIQEKSKQKSSRCEQIKRKITRNPVRENSADKCRFT